MADFTNILGHPRTIKLLIALSSGMQVWEEGGLILLLSQLPSYSLLCQGCLVFCH